MSELSSSLEKPAVVRRAVSLLYLWIVWTVAFGLSQSFAEFKALQSADGMLKGMLASSSGLFSNITIFGYALLALSLIWFNLKISAGKDWARSSLLWGVALQALWELMPPYHPLLDYWQDFPDLGLQAYALFLLYGKEGAVWFKKRA